MSDKIIDVFLLFDPNERNTWTTKVNGKRKVELSKGPNWQGLVAPAKKAGYILNIHGPSKDVSSSAITDSFKNAVATVLVGHGGGSMVGKKWVSTSIKLTDGMILAPNDTWTGGLVLGTWEGGILNPSSSKAVKPKVNEITGLFTCNSHDKLREMFEVPEGGEVVTNDGGADGFTRVGTLENAAYAFVESFIKKGDTKASAAKAQAVFKKSGKLYSGDKGDSIQVGP